MTPRAIACTVLTSGLFTLGPKTTAQEGTWSLSTAAGVSLLQFDAVDEDGRRDIASFNALGIPIGNYPALRYAPVVEAAAQYRFDRDMGVSLFGEFQQARTSTLLHDSLHMLSLDRRLTSVLMGTDISYFFPPLIGDAEVSVFTGLAYLWATADQITNETLTVKIGPGTEPRVVQDAYAKYRKSRLILRVGGRLAIPFNPSTSLLAGVTYQYAKLGTMSGTLREFDLVRPHETSIEFDYSALQFIVGAQYTF